MRWSRGLAGKAPKGVTSVADKSMQVSDNQVHLSDVDFNCNRGQNFLVGKNVWSFAGKLDKKCVFLMKH